MMKIGVAGVGRMGGAMAERLKDVGHEVSVWNRGKERTRPFADKGFQVAATPAELAAGAEIVITMLADAEAIRTVYRGPDGLLKNAGGKLFIEMSTVRPHEQIENAEAVRAAGAAYVECPVGGTVGPARNGKLLGMAGGSQADFDRARPILEQLCGRLDRVGEVGAAASVKLAINLPLLVYWQALGEAYTLCQHLGLDRKWLMGLFAESSGGTNVLKVRADALAEVLGGGDVPAAFAVDMARKDLRTMIAEAQSKGADLPVVASALKVYDEASQQGWGERDASVIPSYWGRKSTGSL
jgi:3-hydroxyisobutyrate dehydrogenase